MLKADKKQNDATLHQRILTDIEGRIVSGEWPPGYRIPFEVDLAKQYECSRMTVNKALTQLARAGLIERIKRFGSFVRQPLVNSAVLEIHDIRKEVESLKQVYSFATSKRALRKATSTDALALDVALATPVLELASVHFAGKDPFCIEARLINLASVPDAADADFTETTASQWLLSRVPWSTAEHRIQAVAADAATAAALAIPKGTACLVVERRTWSNASPVTCVRFTYPGNRHALVARFAPAS